jgi:polyisoprenoid-binding protein YceI
MPGDSRFICRKLVLLCWMTSCIGATASAQPHSSSWQLDAAASELTVHVFKSGLFSGFLHDHLFVPQQWKATAKFDPAHLEDFHAEVSVAVASLKDNQPKLSADDRAKVESQVLSPEVLDAGRFPEIRFVADRLNVSVQKTDELEGTLSGKLSLHGVTRPLDVPVHAWRRGSAHLILGKVAFNQREFGIAPLRKVSGAIAVEDRVLVEFALRLLPSS